MRSLLRVSEWSVPDVAALFETARSMERQPFPKLDGMAAMVFSEPSTRTMVSFQMAANQLGMHVCQLDSIGSSLKKGETLEDTLSTLEAIGVRAAVIRAGDDWPSRLSHGFPSMALVNAGSGQWEHPTQALLDAYTLYQEFGELQGLKVVIAGDVAHSRVARSNVTLLKMMGAEVILSGPPFLSAPELDGAATWMDFDEAVAAADAVMMLRGQTERHAADQMGIDGSYLAKWGMTEQRLETMQPHAILMHPGPVNRDVEIASSLLNHQRSRISIQVKNGVLTRMALLHWCLQGGRREQLVSA